MKKKITATLGPSWRTTLTSYGLALLVALQPLFEESNLSDDPAARRRLLLRALFAAGIALFGKLSADQKNITDTKTDTP